MSTDVVGHLIEVISGQPLDAYLREHIFEPLGMRDTGFVIADEQVPRFAANYQRQADGTLEAHRRPRRRACTGRRASSPAAAGWSRRRTTTIASPRMLLNGGELDGVRLLGRKTVELMTTNHLPGGQDLTAARPGGRRSRRPPTRAWDSASASRSCSRRRGRTSSARPGEYAWGGAASTAFWIDPVEELIVIFMTQLMPSSSYPLRRELRVLTYASLID